MAGRVYVETTIPSAYVSTRTDPSSLHRRELTRAWWADQSPRTNPNKMAHLTVVNRRLGLLTPQVVTPEVLWLEDET